MTSYLAELKQRSETEFLEFRQRIKESIRINKQNGKDVAPTSESEQMKRKLYEFGSFFGPSQPGIASRVLQESKPLLKDELLAAKMLDSIQSKKSSGPTTGSEVNEQLKRKAEELKESRDYSFLFSDDSELPVSIMELPLSNAHVPNSTPSSRGGQTDHSRQDSSGSRVRSRPGSSTKGQAQTKPCSARYSQKHKPSSRLSPQRPAPARKHVPMDHSKKRTQKPLSSSKLLTSGHKQQRVEQRKVSNELKSSSQMVIRKPPLKQPNQLKKKKEMSEEDEQALRMIRGMFKTDRFSGRDLEDYDDRGMEASLEDIIKEEKRSEKLAKKEDAEQLRLIEEEARRERVMRKEKKLKLVH